MTDDNIALRTLMAKGAGAAPWAARHISEERSREALLRALSRCC